MGGAHLAAGDGTMMGNKSENNSCARWIALGTVFVGMALAMPSMATTENVLSFDGNDHVLLMEGNDLGYAPSRTVEG